MCLQRRVGQDGSKDMNILKHKHLKCEGNPFINGFEDLEIQR